MLSAQGPSARLERLIAAEPYQIELPRGAAGEPPPSVSTREPVVPREPELRRPTPERQSVDGFVSLATVVVVAAALALLAVGALMIARQRRGGRDPGLTEPARPRPAPAAGVPDTSLDRACSLAAEGHAADAVRLLLRASIAGLTAGRGLRIADWMTGRALLRAVELPPAAHDALRELVATAERGGFAGQPLTAADFERCRTAFHVLGGGAGAAS